MIKYINEFIEMIINDLTKWDEGVKPWFRGESGSEHPPLCPKIAPFEHYEENYLLQSFRRQAGGIANVPQREDTDLWLFRAQHYGIPTRLLDWTEGALMALYFAINRKNDNPRVYMLNPRKLNDLAGIMTYPLNYPLSWVKAGALYVALAWQNRNLEQIKRIMEQQVRQKAQNQDPDEIERDLDSIREISLKIPIAFPATYQDQRMIAQRSCFTIHGTELQAIPDILKDNGIDATECLFEYKIDREERGSLLKTLSLLGISAASIFPDLDHLTIDLKSDIDGF